MPNSKSRSFSFRDMENNFFRMRRFSFPKRSLEFIALIAVSCTFFLFMHTKNLNSRLHEMEIKMQPSELSAMGLTGSNSILSNDPNSLKGLHGTYQYLKSTGQIKYINTGKLNNTKTSGMNIIFFNRVPKVGSQTLMMLMNRLGKKNSFKQARDKIQSKEVIVMLPDEQLDVIEDITDLDEPSVYTKHVAYINFTQFDYPKPIYINLIRDPVERLISWFYYIRTPWYFVERKQKFKNLPFPKTKWLKKDFDSCVLEQDRECIFAQGTKTFNGDHRRQMLFFCGHDLLTCMPFNAYKSMQQAKETVEKDYAVVGTWEATNITLTVLENYIPLFFTGATTTFYRMNKKFIKSNRNMYKPPVSEKVKEVLRKNLTNEIEFYQFCKQRLYKQYLALQLNNNIY